MGRAPTRALHLLKPRAHRDRLPRTNPRASSLEVCSVCYEMARSPRGRRVLSSPHRSSQDPSFTCQRLIRKGGKPDKPCKVIKNDWENATCSVCMEYPHNAVLLLCSSHDKGCRPYMCRTSYRFSNCLDQFLKAYSKTKDAAINPSVPNMLLKNKSEITELACPLCRGEVKGSTVVEVAREYLNKKKRSCMQDGCSFIGNYKQLRKHVKVVHPSCHPHQVDPLLEEKWKTFQDEREREDVMTTIRSSTPGAMVLGDYVIENDGFDSDLELLDEEGNLREQDGLDRNWLRFLWLLHRFGNSRNAGLPSQMSFRAVSDLGRSSTWSSQSASDLPLQGEASYGEADAFLQESGNDNDDDDEPSLSGFLSRERLLGDRNGRSRSGTNSRRRLLHLSP